MNICNKEFPICENENPKPVFKKDGQNIIHFKKILEKQYAEKSKASMSIKLIKHVNSLTFHLQEEETSDKLEEDLMDILENF